MIRDKDLIRVPLDEWEERTGQIGAEGRMGVVVQRNLKGLANQPPERAAHDHLIGVHGEQGHAKWTGVFFNPTIGKIGLPDLAPGYQIRSTDLVRGRLLVRPKTDDFKQIFILTRVQLKPLIVTLVGWCWGGDIFEWWVEPLRRGGEVTAWAIDTADLTPMEKFDVGSFRRVYQRYSGCPLGTDTRSVEPAGPGTSRDAVRPQEIRAVQASLF